MKKMSEIFSLYKFWKSFVFSAKTKIGAVFSILVKSCFWKTFLVYICIINNNTTQTKISDTKFEFLQIGGPPYYTCMITSFYLEIQKSSKYNAWKTFNLYSMRKILSLQDMGTGLMWAVCKIIKCVTRSSTIKLIIISSTNLF